MNKKVVFKLFMQGSLLLFSYGLIQLPLKMNETVGESTVAFARGEEGDAEETSVEAYLSQVTLTEEQ